VAEGGGSGVAVWLGFAFGVVEANAVAVGPTVRVGVGDGGLVGDVVTYVGVAEGMGSGVGD